MKSSELAELLSIFQRFVAGLQDAQIKQLLGGQGKLQLSLLRDDQLYKKDAALGSSKSADIIQLLGNCKDRSSGIEFLQAYSKSDLLSVVKFLDIHVDRSANKAQVVEKIVERTVGARLRRSAIDSLAAH
jgi:hypothetical protein